MPDLTHIFKLLFQCKETIEKEKEIYEESYNVVKLSCKQIGKDINYYTDITLENCALCNRGNCLGYKCGKTSYLLKLILEHLNNIMFLAKDIKKLDECYKE